LDPEERKFGLTIVKVKMFSPSGPYDYLKEPNLKLFKGLGIGR